jgi:preprotein translocase subunit YajC
VADLDQLDQLQPATQVVTVGGVVVVAAVD